MTDPFVHLHVASGYSLRYGASLPPVLVARAADHGMDTLALTDHDGVYGAVKFVRACTAAGLRPILGTDLAVDHWNECAPHPGIRGGTRPTSPGVTRRTPARGGAFADGRDSPHPRVTLLAANRRGWATLCRLVSATHLAGERGRPVTTPDLIASHLGRSDAGGVVVVLGPSSDVGRALVAG